MSFIELHGALSGHAFLIRVSEIAEFGIDRRGGGSFVERRGESPEIERTVKESPAEIAALIEQAEVEALADRMLPTATEIEYRHYEGQYTHAAASAEAFRMAEAHIAYRNARRAERAGKGAA